MKVLLLSPQPYYSERGTPIAVDHVVRALSERGDHVDVLTYHLGADVEYANVRIHRIPPIGFVRDVPAGPSIRKLLCSSILFLHARRMVREGRFDVIHAVEEAAIVAAMIRGSQGTPFVYDMDSSLPQQIVAAYPILRPLTGWLQRLERQLVQRAAVVLAASRPVSEVARCYRSNGVVRLPDISLIEQKAKTLEPGLRDLCGARGPLALYAGSLAKNRGIALLLESFAIARSGGADAHLAVIGGTPAEIEAYRKQAERLGLAPSTSFLGPRPIRDLGGYLAEADILVSPQTEAVNTPMKLYSYLASGKPILATDLPAHRAVVDDGSAMLAAPRPQAFAEALLALLADPGRCRRLGEQARTIAGQGHDYQDFRRVLWGVYDDLERPRRVC